LRCLFAGVQDQVKNYVHGIGAVGAVFEVVKSLLDDEF
jgi:hypothetical protein